MVKTLFINSTPVRNGKASAVCACCNKKSRPVAVDRQGEPDMWMITRGWTSAPYPADHVHNDGSKGSTWTCPACNKRLRAGESLKLRSGGMCRLVG